MSEENKTVELNNEELENELNNEELEKISGGDVGDDAYCMFRWQCNGGQNCKAPAFRGGSGSMCYYK